MKKKKIIGLVFSLIFLLMFVGCSRDQIADQITKEDQQELLISNNAKKEYEKITLEELEEKLMESIGIELKSTDNQVVGFLQKREEIIGFVEQMVAYPKQEEFPMDTSNNQVIGPINFYFNGDDDIYGLVKDNYIYIEGYYFLLTNTEAKKIEKFFQSKIIQAPISGN